MHLDVYVNLDRVPCLDRLRAALNGTIGALRSESTMADRDASDDVTNAHRHIRAYNRGALDEDDFDQQRKPSLRLPAWTRTMVT